MSKSKRGRHHKNVKNNTVFAGNVDKALKISQANTANTGDNAPKNTAPNANLDNNETNGDKDTKETIANMFTNGNKDKDVKSSKTSIVDASKLSGVKLGKNDEIHSIHLENSSTVNVNFNFTDFAEAAQIDKIVAFLRSSKAGKDSAVSSTMNTTGLEWSLGESNQFIITTVGILGVETQLADRRYVHESIQTVVNFLKDIGIRVNEIEGVQTLVSPVEEAYKFYVSDEGILTHEKI